MPRSPVGGRPGDTGRKRYVSASPPWAWQHIALRHKLRPHAGGTGTVTMQFGARLRLRLRTPPVYNPATHGYVPRGCRIRTAHRPAAAVATRAKPRTAAATNSAFLPSDYAKQPRISPLAENRSAAHSHCSKTISSEHTMFKLALGLLTALILASCAYAPTPTANIPSGVGHPDATYPGPRAY